MNDSRRVYNSSPPRGCNCDKNKRNPEEPLLVLLGLRGATEHQAPRSWQQQGPKQGTRGAVPQTHQPLLSQECFQLGLTRASPYYRKESSTDNLNTFQKKINQGAKAERRRRVGYERMFPLWAAPTPLLNSAWEEQESAAVNVSSHSTSSHGSTLCCR